MRSNKKHRNEGFFKVGVILLLINIFFSGSLSPTSGTGYQGYAPEIATIIQPVKKSKGKVLSEEQKELNKKVSSIRVCVEHAIGSAKFMRIVKDECCLRANSFVERIFVTCAALHNLRIKNKPWVYKN